MALYKVIAEQKITKRVLAVVEANSDEEAMDKVCNRDIISIESSFDTKIEGFIPLKSERY